MHVYDIFTCCTSALACAVIIARLRDETTLVVASVASLAYRSWRLVRDRRVMRYTSWFWIDVFASVVAGTRAMRVHPTTCTIAATLSGASWMLWVRRAFGASMALHALSHIVVLRMLVLWR